MCVSVCVCLSVCLSVSVCVSVSVCLTCDLSDKMHQEYLLEKSKLIIYFTLGNVLAIVHK